ncbi:MAG: hypothetical protein KC433_14260 [Anaerolineales bacterium]|nr:hypothetical protein [Anaerolineales bacterium]MCB8937891.1 hypothetical protein [Ardenticatenaceae bacterium]
MSKKVAALLLIVSLFAISCTAAQDAGAQPEVNTAEPYEWVLTALRDNGTAVEALSTISQPFFEPEGQVIQVDGQEVQLFAFPNEAEAATAAATIDASGSTVGTTMLSWLATPHFFKSGNLIVLYVGDTEAVIAALQGVLGSQIAGGSTAQSALPPVVEINTTETLLTNDQQEYANSAFGLSFLLPANWFGPEEYVSEQTLRVEVGTDAVYPYGTDPTERPEAKPNAYHVVVQYDKDGQSGDMNDTYQTLAAMQDGESLSDARGMIIRIRPLDLNGLTGYEYIATLSETAQTTAVYSRMSILTDAQGNFVTVLGTPSQVELADGTSWQDAYRLIDEVNLPAYHQIVSSISVAD